MTDSETLAPEGAPRTPQRSTARRRRAHMALLALVALACAWTLGTWLTGGFVIDAGPLRVSSRNPRNPLLLALLALAAAWALSAPGAWCRSCLSAWTHLSNSLAALASTAASTSRWTAPAVAGALAIATAGAGVMQGALVAGGADSYGYVSQAHLWATGRLHVDEPLLLAPPGGSAPEALVPLGYRIGTDRTTLVPIYAPGLPIAMAGFERIAGMDAVFYVMPVLAGIAVAAAYLLGSRAGGRLAGVLAAVLLATSPAFLFQLLHAPMSDIPAAAWWTLSLLLVHRCSGASALLAGVAAGAAILTRPNLVPVALVPGCVLLWNVAFRRDDHAAAIRRLILFAAGSIPFALTIAWLNAQWYGSPLESGYGPLGGTFYRWSHLGPNLTRYAGWMAESQTPLICLAAAAPLLAFAKPRTSDHGSTSRALLLSCTGLALAVFACYAWYLPFEAWWFLRFLLPAFPAVFVLMGVSIARLSSRLPAWAQPVALLAIVSVLVWHSVAFGRTNDVFESAGEWRFATAGRYVAARLPERAVLFSMLHSGSARYYSGRMTVRYDHLAASELQSTMTAWRRLGYVPFVLLDDSEEQDFVSMFGDVAPLGASGWPAVARLDGVTIYDASVSVPPGRRVSQ